MGVAVICAVLCMLLPVDLYGQENWVEKGLELSKAGQYDPAIEAFSKAIGIDPENVDAYNNRGAVWYYKDALDRAISDFSRALKIDPSHTEACNNRGLVWFRQKDFNRAIADFTRALEFNPAYEDAYVNRGIVWYHKKDFDAAIDDYTRAIEINPDVAVTYNNRGAAWHSKGAYHQAIIDYTQALKRDSTLFDAFKNRAVAWYQIGIYERAVADFSTALALRPDAARVYDDRGRVFFKKGNYALALSDFRHALELDGHLTDACRHLAWMLAVCPDERYRNGKQAIELVDESLSGQPGTWVKEILAAAYAETGRYREAVDTQKEAIAAIDRYKNPVQWEASNARLKNYQSNRAWREKTRIRVANTGDLPVQVSIVASTAEVHNRPDKVAQSIGTLSQGDRLLLIDRIKQWGFVEDAENRFGWVHASLFGAEKGDIPKAPKAVQTGETGETAAAETVAVRVALAQFRRHPDADAEVVFRLIEGAAPVVLEREGDWYRVRLRDGRTGWGHASSFWRTKRRCSSGDHPGGAIGS